MDPQVDVLYGPRPIQKTGNVSVPKDLLREIGVVAGTDRVHFALNPEIPGTLLLIPGAQLNRALPKILRSLRESGS